MIHIRNLLDLECDTEGCSEQQGFLAEQDESIRELKHQARGYGWLFKRNKQIYCPLCAAKYFGHKENIGYISSVRPFPR